MRSFQRLKFQNFSRGNMSSDLPNCHGHSVLISSHFSGDANIQMMMMIMMMMMMTLFNESERATTYASNIITKTCSTNNSKRCTVLSRKKYMYKYLRLRRIGNISSSPEEITLISFPTTNMSISKPMVKCKKTISIRNSFMIPIHELQISSTFLRKDVVHTM